MLAALQAPGAEDRSQRRGAALGEEVALRVHLHGKDIAAQRKLWPTHFGILCRLPVACRSKHANPIACSTHAANAAVLTLDSSRHTILLLPI